MTELWELLLTDKFAWVIPAVIGALLTLIVSSIGAISAHYSQLDTEEKRDNRKREWEIKDRKQERQRNIFDQHAREIYTCLAYLNESVSHCLDIAIMVQQDKLKLSDQGFLSTNDKRYAAHENALSLLLHFNLIYNQELLDLRKKLFEDYSNLFTWVDNMIQKKKAGNKINRNEEYKLFGELHVEYGYIYGNIQGHLDILSRQFY
ncbi:MAG: hypothetical protein HN736_15280 [Anaerolineae bacterium]|jgi:hypothetical protein|nr:hypothetical protein [Anaerolineae bacterium]MBT4311693.1 hypothetical protein [Anaerolineae bacterium]MBT4457744.1 hypothetical protein [Anaerolineae bacterium]MBT6061183.1 hypothetical protein [Anaerolineae bacterium]MBT6321153.1 hypothetical protein [Anaerolineae bacterium]